MRVQVRVEMEMEMKLVPVDRLSVDVMKTEEFMRRLSLRLYAHTEGNISYFSS